MALVILACIWTAKSQLSCTNPVPGIDRMGVGVDLSTFDTWNPVYSSALGPVQNITCNKKITWLNPISGVTYDVPDQLAEPPLEIPKSVAKYDSAMLQTTYQLEVDMAASVSESYVFGMASKSKSLSDSYQYTSSQYRFLGVANSTVTSFQITFLPHSFAPDTVGLSENAKSGINSLPPRFNASTIKNYEEFIGYFGTHYATQALAGGSFRCDYYTQKSFTSVMDTLSISEQGGYDFSGFLQKSGAVAVTVAPVVQAWLDVTTISCSCYGGAGCPDSQPSYETWAKDLYSIPWLFQLSYEPIYNLISDSVKQASMVLAVANHFAHSYLEYEAIPALNIFAIMVKNAFILEGNPACPLPSNSHMFPCSSAKCGAAESCSSAQNGQWCRTRTGAPFTTDYNNVNAQKPVVANTISTLLNEANAEPIVNITQLNAFGNQFIALVGIMESQIIVKTCQYSKPQQICR